MEVRLPHTSREVPYHYFDESEYQMNCGYRKVIVPEDAWKNKVVLMTVEAAAHESEVFLNGESIYKHCCGYTAYTIDITNFLKWNEENILVIRVDSRETLNQPPFGNVIDYMTFGGLYREVYLEIKETSYIKDVFPKVIELKNIDKTKMIADAVLVCEVEINNPENTVVIQELYDDSEQLIGTFTDVKNGNIVKKVHLWNLDKPALYRLRTKLLKEDTVIDEKVERIGFRTVEFRDDGLYLNDEKIKIRGLNRHQSFPYVGYAMPKSMQRQDAKILKEELGVNAVRTSHYPQSHYFLEACDELGLLVFTEIPGWQHIGDENWKKQAIKNTEDMVKQYRNHPSIFLWGVRINESIDDDDFYIRTNEAAHKLDNTRPTSGVRYLQKSSLLEDVYAFNDFSHDGTNNGTLKKQDVTPDMKKGYFISEFNGHMYPTKSFDAEDHRVEHMLRHVRVMDSYYGKDDIGGGFGWCMFDYNTHKDFGSGDRICYHGVLDMFRNPKLAASVYSAQKKPLSENDVMLEISSSMDIGEHPACLMKDVYVVTNADSVRVYKNDYFIGEYNSSSSEYKNLPYGPIRIDDFIGDLMEKRDEYSHKKAEDIKKVLLAVNKYGRAHLPLKIKLLAAKCMLLYKMKEENATQLYNKYVGDWGGTSTTYRFEAVWQGKVVKVVEKSPMSKISLKVDVSSQNLCEDSTYDVAAVRISAVSETGATLPFYSGPVQLKADGPMELIGPSSIALHGGMGGTYVKSVNQSGKGTLTITADGIEPVEITFDISAKKA